MSRGRFFAGAFVGAVVAILFGIPSFTSSGQGSKPPLAEVYCDILLSYNRCSISVLGTGIVALASAFLFGVAFAAFGKASSSDQTSHKSGTGQIAPPKGGHGKRDLFLEEEIKRKLEYYKAVTKYRRQRNVLLIDQFNRLKDSMSLGSIGPQRPRNIKKALEQFEGKDLDEILANSILTDSKQLIEDFRPYNIEEASETLEEIVQALDELKKRSNGKLPVEMHDALTKRLRKAKKLAKERTQQLECLNQIVKYLETRKKDK